MKLALLCLTCFAAGVATTLWAIGRSMGTAAKPELGLRERGVPLVGYHETEYDGYRWWDAVPYVPHD